MKLFVAAFLAAPGLALAAGWDLGSDWSDLSNPNGQWTLEKNINTPFTIVQSDFYSDGTFQKAWADDPYPANSHVPVWMKCTTLAGLDVQLGDVVAHGAVQWRTGSVYTSAMWTSPLDGTATMSGSTWLALQRNRQMDWRLLKNGLVLTSGHMFGDGTYTRAHQFNFEAGSGGVGALTQAVSVGDRLEFQFFSLDDLPDMAGVNFHIEAVPEPASMAAFGIGLAMLARRRRRNAG